MISDDSQGIVFTWHPDYAGHTAEQIRSSLREEIASDQRAYQAILDQSEANEFDAFQSIRDLDTRWSRYDFGWAETSPEILANAIASFEEAREREQQMLSWEEWKASNQTAGSTTVDEKPEKRDWRENLTDEQRRRIASGLAIIVMIGIFFLCILGYYILR